MDEPQPQREVTDLPVEEGYVVTKMRTTGDVLRFNRDLRPHLICHGEAVCTYETLFRMLGRGVVALDPSATQMDRYFLTEEWK